MYDVILHDEVRDDLLLLPDNVLSEVMAYFDKYVVDPFSCSQRLYNQSGRDLSSCRKTYAANAKYRIIIQIENDVTKIVSVVCVGERQDMTAYEIAFQRITSQK